MRISQRRRRTYSAARRCVLNAQLYRSLLTAPAGRLKSPQARFASWDQARLLQTLVAGSGVNSVPHSGTEVAEEEHLETNLLFVTRMPLNNRLEAEGDH